MRGRDPTQPQPHQASMDGVLPPENSSTTPETPVRYVRTGAAPRKLTKSHKNGSFLPMSDQPSNRENDRQQRLRPREYAPENEVLSEDEAENAVLRRFLSDRDGFKKRLRDVTRTLPKHKERDPGVVYEGIQDSLNEPKNRPQPPISEGIVPASTLPRSRRPVRRLSEIIPARQVAVSHVCHAPAHPASHTDEEHILEPAHPWLVFSLRFLAYALPLGFLLYVLYWNFLPFGYEKTFTIDVGSKNDTKGEFRLEPSRDLSEPITAPDGTAYRQLNGVAYAVFEPKAVLKDAEITVEVEGEGVSIIPPVIDFDPNSVNWDYSWDFTQGIPPELQGNAFAFDDCPAYFDGASRLELPNSADLFENGPFTIYAEWTPSNNTLGRQEIIGHYNWEIYQNIDSVQFTIGRMNNSTGQFYTIKYSTGPNFFENKHSLVATYFPSDTNGYIELFVDNQYVERKYIGTNVIYTDYNSSRNLSLGKSDHGTSNFFRGCVHEANITTTPIVETRNVFHIDRFEKVVYIPLVSSVLKPLDSLLLHAKTN